MCDQADKVSPYRIGQIAVARSARIAKIVLGGQRYCEKLKQRKGGRCVNKPVLVQRAEGSTVLLYARRLCLTTSNASSSYTSDPILAGRVILCKNENAWAKNKRVLSSGLSGILGVGSVSLWRIGGAVLFCSWPTIAFNLSTSSFS